MAYLLSTVPMRTSATLLGLGALACLACQPAPDAAARSPTRAPSVTAAQPDTAGAAAFVRAFYADYTPRAIDGGLAVLDSLLVQRPALFTPELLAALRRDADARRRAEANGQIDGLDGDPFLDAQDPCEAYVVGHASPEAAGVGVLVRVHAVCRGRREAQPAAVLALRPTGTTWQIANVRYQSPADDLLTMLRALHPSP